MIYVITVAYCPSVQLESSLLKYFENSNLNANEDAVKEVVVQGHYPINKKKNNRDIEMICEMMEVDFMDPGKNLGSAQSQNWVLEQLNVQDKDYWVNWDPDTNCTKFGWDEVMKNQLDFFENCVAIHCWSKLWEPFRNRLGTWLSQDNQPAIACAGNPIPFNLTMFKCSFIKQMGGLRQLGENWGELEAPFHQSCITHGKYHAYLMDYIEDESGKLMQDKQFLEYKDAYMRTDGPDRFVGTFEEFLKRKYPELIKMDTLIPLDTQFK